MADDGLTKRGVEKEVEETRKKGRDGVGAEAGVKVGEASVAD